jgi:hypothetical protein
LIVDVDDDNCFSRFREEGAIQASDSCEALGRYMPALDFVNRPAEQEGGLSS